MNESWYCSSKCFESAVCGYFGEVRPHRPSSHLHRIPLGLQLLEQERIRLADLQAALQHQRAHPNEPIGQCLATVCGVSEDIVAQAIAGQWGCPVFSAPPRFTYFELRLPYAVLREHGAVPVYWDSRGRVLYLGFSCRIDHVCMAGIEIVLQCKVKPCVLRNSEFRQRMLDLAENGSERTAMFPPRLDAVRGAHILRNYVDEAGADEVRVGFTSRYVWARLAHTRITDLLFERPTYAEVPGEI